MYDCRSRFLFLLGTVIDVTSFFTIDANTDLEHSDDNNDNTLHHISTHANTHKCSQHRHITLLNTYTTPPSTFFSAQIRAHFIPNGTRLAQEYLDNCFLHDANMFAKQGMDRRCMHSGPQDRSEPCVQREPTNWTSAQSHRH